MKKILPILLIGCLSMFFAEIFSGASQVWYINVFSLTIAFPIYLLHTIFLLCIALRMKKTSLSALYFLGVIFALYEAFITKVLWEGYIDQDGLGLGKLFSLSIAEFPILVFFWHPVMSFILPILVYQIITKQVLIDHSNILKRTKKKTITLIIFLILVSTFIANGNGFDLTSSNLALIGTIMLVIIFSVLSKRQEFNITRFKEISLPVTAFLLGLIYVLSFFFLLPERIPKEQIAYISIGVCYLVAVFFIFISRKTSQKLIELDDSHYSLRHLFLFSLITIVSVNLANLVPDISDKVLSVTYMLLSALGTVIFFMSIFDVIKKLFKINLIEEQH